MREIKRLPNESLDDAFKRLQEAGKRVHVYMKFEKHNIYSNYTLEEAYKEVYGMSRDKYLAKQAQAEGIPVEVEETESVFDDTPGDVIRDLRISILINAVDESTGLYKSEIAMNYLRKMNKYSVYCTETTKDEWIRDIAYYVYSVGRKIGDEEEFSDYQIEEFLNFYEMLGKIMELISKGVNWDEIKKLVMSYNLSPDDTESLKEKMLYYSPFGDDFITNVFGKGPKALNKKDNN